MPGYKIHRVLGESVVFCWLAVLVIALPGDTTNDGMVDGRDALKIMRYVEGLEILAPAEQTAADVHPAPGTDGRTIGDGVINEDDALRILYHAVGLIPEGEITGDYSASAPRILDFTPRSGPVGTAVTIEGRNFVGAWPGENQAFFSGMQSPIESISNWRIITRVPEGALSGALSVKTPGGTAVSALEFTVTEVVQGRVELGAGLNPADFTVTNVFGETTPNAATGEFALMLPRDKPALIGAVPKGTGENCFLAMYLPPAAGAPTKSRIAATQPGPLVVDAQSTAYTLIFMHPFLMTTDMATVRSLFALMEPLAAVQNLAQVIGQRYPQGADGLDDPLVEAAWEQAVAAVLEALPDGMKFSKALPAPSAARASGPKSADSFPGRNVLDYEPDSPALLADTPAAPKVRFLKVDLDYLEFRYNASRNQILSIVAGGGYSPVDWLVTLYQLDPRDMPRGINERVADLKKRNIRRVGQGNTTLVPSNLWTAKIDVLGQALDFAMNTLLDWVGLGGGDPNFPLEYQTDAVYMIRAFSGAFKDRWQYSGDDAVAMKAVAGDTTHGNYATGINVVLALVDVWSLVAGPENAPSKEAIKTGFQNAIVALSREMGGRSLGELTSERALQVLLTIVIETSKGIAVAYAKEGLSQAQKKLQGQLQKALGKAVPLLEKLYYISCAGRIGERIVGLMGYIVNPLQLEIVYGPTPLEVAFVVVGDPFSPILESISPDSGGVTTEITLTGRRFAPKAEDNKVRFGSKEAEVVSVNSEGTELVVRVPEGLNEWNNPITIRVDTPASMQTGSLGGFIFKDIPVLNSLSIAAGYAESPNPEGKPFAGFAGTVVGLRGWKLEKPVSGPNIEVYFGFTKANIIFQSTITLQANVPAMASTGPHDVYIRYMTGEGWRETQHLSFFVYGPPRISQLTPTSVAAGELLDITGNNFLDCQVLVKDSMATVRALDPLTRIVATMPNVGEGGEQLALEVWNPAGSASRTITRQPGIQAPDPNPLPEGFRLYINTNAAGMDADGNLSLDEAMAFARGELNFWAGNDYDDCNEEWTHSWRQVRYGTDPDYTYEWVEISVDKVILTTNNGPYHETRKHLRISTYHADYGGDVVGPFNWWTEDLDDESDDDHKKEEGDRLQPWGPVENYSSYNGANYSDILVPQSGVRTYFSNTGIRVGRSDMLDFADTTIQVNSGQNILLDDTFIFVPAIESSSPIRIEGNNVRLGPSQSHQRLEIRGGAGIQIAQSFRAQVGSIRIIDHAGDAVTLTNSGLCEVAGIFENLGGAGIRATQSDENYFSGTVTNAEAGFVIDQGKGNAIYGIVARNLTGAAVEISDSSGTIAGGLDVDACGSGITMTKAVQSHIGNALIRNCEGNGISITGGRANRLAGPIKSLRNAGHGVEVANSPLNEIANTECAGNQKSGLELHGQESAYNTIYTFTGGRYYDANESEHVLLGNTQHGIHLYGGANHTTIGSMNTQAVLVDNGGHGALLEGAGTSHNTLHILSGYGHGVPDRVLGGNTRDGLRISSGAAHNKLVHSKLSGNGGNGVTLEGTGTEYNAIIGSWIGTTVIREGDTDTPKPNLGVGLWITSPARMLTVDDTIIGIHEAGGVYCGQMNQTPPEGEWNVSFINCRWGQSHIQTLTSPRKTAAQNPSPERQKASSAIGLQIDATTHCRLDNCIIQNYGTGLWIGGAPSTGHHIDLYTFDCAQDGIYLDQVFEQVVKRLEFHFSGRHGLYMKNCRALVTGEKQLNGQSNTGHGVLVENCEDILFSHLVSNNNAGDGLRAVNSRRIQTEQCYFIGNQGDGISLREQSNTILISGGFSVQNTQYGLRIENVSNVAAGATDYFDNVAGAVLVSNSNQVEIGNDQEAENLSMGCEENPVLVITGENTQQVRVRGCYFSSSPGPGQPILLVDGGSDILIGHENPLLGNYINGDGRTGILAKGNVTDLRIVSNRIGAPPNPPFSTASNQYGIALDDGIQGVVVTGNMISHNQSHGVVIQGGANANALSGNTITRNGGDGVRVSGPTTRRNMLSRNIITDNAGKGIALAGGNDNIAAPLITNISPGSRAVSGSIHPVPPAGTRVEVYADRGDEGESLLGISPVFGNNFSITSPIPPGRQLHAVAIHPNGNTSEFGDSQQEELPENHPFVFAEGKPGSRVIKAADPDWPLPRPVIVSPHDDFSPRMDPNGAALLFTSDRNGNLDLFHHRIETEITTPITTHAADDHDPAWHAATGKIAFVSLRDGNAEIYSIPDYQTTETTRLTNNPAEDRHPAWSPNGDRIAFASNRGGNMDIWIMNADGSNPQRLTDGTGTNTQPAWSPDGASIAFVSNRDGNNEIYTIGADGSNLSRMTNDPADDCNPAWTANGTFILFSSDRESGYEIYSVQTTTRRVNRLTIAPLDAMQPHAGVQWSGFALLSARIFAKPASTQSTGIRDADANALKTATTVITASAADDAIATLTLLNASATPGQTVAVTMQFRASPGAVPPSGIAGNLAWELRYDPAVFEVVEPPLVGLGLGPCAVAPAQFPDDSGVLIINGVRASGVGGDGNALTFRLRVKASATPQRSPIRFQSAEAWSLDYLGIPLGTQDAELAVDYQPAQGVFWILIGQD
jgi:TolB protein